MSGDPNPNLIGAVAELKIAAEATRLGIDVLRPMTEHCRYDLVFEIDGNLFRIQCKSAPRNGEIVSVRTESNRRGPDGFIRRQYTAEEIDAVAAYCPELDRCYLLPIGMVAERRDLAAARSAQERPARLSKLGRRV